jgi:pSer/pThr/pTyr-binding forkhead associated (FHA) protein
MSYEGASGPELIVQHTGQVFPIGLEVVTIGRQEDNVIILADPQVSAHHATISLQAETGICILEDQGSANGTFVNEVRIEKPEILRHGDVIRMGNTIMDLRQESPPEGAMSEPPAALRGFEESGPPSRSPVLAGILIALLAGFTIVCLIVFATLLLGRGKGTPDVIIQSPGPGAQISVGNEIILQATASGAKDITRLELSVDGILAATTSNPVGSSSLTVNKPWTFATPGEHMISAEAYTASGKRSSPASVKVSVVAAGIRPTATPTPAPGEPTSTPTPTFTDTPEPEDTATPPPTTVPPPLVEFFQASPSSIDAGGCTTLQWGKVQNATEASIEPGIGGVGTPGSQTVCPPETTTYLLTATGPGGTTEASTTVTVIGGLPDLAIDSVTFSPDPPVAGQDNAVQIAIQNVGIGAAGAFNWQWQAGSDALFDGRVYGLDAGGSTVVTLVWNPLAPYDNLSTEALVDSDDEVVETDKGNNRYVAAIQVVEGIKEPETITFKSEGALDGYRLNDGSGSNTQDILVGNGELVDPVGELVARGFMSFDLSSIPAGATVESAELRFYQKEIQGDPYTKLGNLLLEHVDYGASLDDSAYNTPAIESAVLDQQRTPGAWYILSDLTLASWIQSNVEAGRSRFQVRLQFRQETDGDSSEDWVAIQAGGGVLGSRNSPQLTITYVP